MGNFDNIFKATLSSNHTIEVHVNKSYSPSFAKQFFLYQDNERICALTIKERSETQHYFHYILGDVPSLIIGTEYRVYDERYLFCYLNMNVLLKDEKICSLYYTDKTMGAHYHKLYTTFRLFSPLATNAYVVYELNNREIVLSLSKDSDKGIFEGRVNGDIAGAKYYFIVRINGELISSNDPYARCLTKQSNKGIVLDPERVKVDLNEDNLPEFTNSLDAIIYELSVRDMTSMADTQIINKGKYLGLTERGRKSKNHHPIGIDYLKHLGITHVQLMPIFDFCTVSDQFHNESYNWGYDPLFYNSPEGSYSSDPNDHYKKIIELKEMISSFHQLGIRVVMDVVYNHVFNMESSVFEKICPSYYFRYKKDGHLSNGSFCGNEFNSTNPMARKFIIDSCMYWVREFGIDGFRFDLMGLIDVETINIVKEKCSLLKPGFIIYGEGWDMPTTLSGEMMSKLYNADKIKNVGFFNDRFRDIVKGRSGDMELAIKGYLLGDFDYIDGFKHCFLGSTIPLAFPPLFSSATQSINYVECHDNATLYDKLLISNAMESEEIRLKRIKLINAINVLSLGVPFLHAGQEIGLSKKGVYNSYAAGDEINSFDYNVMDERWSMVEYLKDIIKIRKEFSVFKMRNRETISKSVEFKNLDCGALLIKFPDNLKMIINPSTQSFDYDNEEKYYLLADENGLAKEKVSYRQIIINPISLVILVRK